MTEPFFQSSKGNARFVVPRPLKIGIHCIVFTLLAVFGLTASTCENVTGPDGIIQRDWKILYRDRDRTISRFYILSTSEKRFVDSIVVPYSGELIDAALTASGRNLFIVGLNNTFEVLKYAYPSLTLVDTVEQGSRYQFGQTMPVEPSPAGGTFLLGTISTDTSKSFDLLLIDERTLETEFVFPEDTRIGHFSANGRTVVTADVMGEVRIRDVNDLNTVEHSIRPNEGGGKIFRCTNSGSHLFTYSSVAFSAYNLESGTLDFRISLIGSGDGSMHVTPDGKYAVYTSPGSFNFPGDDSLRIYDVDARGLDTTILALDIIEGTNHSSDLDRFSMSPDGVWLFSNNGEIFGGDHCMLFNLQERRVDSTVYLYGWGNNVNVVEIPYSY